MISASEKNLMETRVEAKSYQKDGISWMIQRVEERKGFILGDEMGMGKTMQIISVIENAWKEEKRAILILAPNSVLNTWKNEWIKMKAEVPLLILSANDKNIGETLRKSEGRHVVCMGYDLAQRKGKTLMRMAFDILVLDEAQRIKNKETKISILCRRIDSRIKACITGTPVQNNLSELWSIVDMVSPGYLGDANRFKIEVEDPIRKSKLKRATDEEKQAGKAISIHLNEMISQIMLRRTKNDYKVIKAEVEERKIYCPLTPIQQKLYKEALTYDQTRAAVLGKTNPLKIIAYLRRICIHPLLHINTSTEEEIEHPKISRRIPPTNFYKEHPQDVYLKESGKVQMLLQLIDQWKTKNRKILIFSQYKGVLSILEDVLPIPLLRMDGETSLSKRSEILKAFGTKSGTEALLLTTRVGGVGINIQQANTIILFDMDWNPFNDEQAKGRAHRIGQTQNIEVYRFICKGTIEESISICQEMKKIISQNVLEKHQNKKVFDKIDLCRLFHYSYDSMDVTDISQY
ncbi:DNA excision repair protein ERCC-6 [Nematocida sp. LUAm3]|nr:DNA excision repair protein ERCC-6 [Nematocida sp. LUAm3]KAI5173756.1 DNA excision repair protein ERCC-6 [Nematocida sp. LUAm2]KAI5176979.1 DNA excision repair protein ERCC-6 [Nematocida sp. LUAm1]